MNRPKPIEETKPVEEAKPVEETIDTPPPGEACAHPERRDALLAAAETVFLKKGYHAATMDDVARAACMSKKTVYQLIASKEDLFAALLAHQRAPMQCRVTEAGRAPEEVLGEILRQWLSFILSPSHIATLRLILAEYTHCPDLGRMFHQKPEAAGRNQLENYLATLAAGGAIEIESPEEAASMLLGLAIGKFHIDLMLGLTQEPTQAELDRRIRRAVRLFLRGSRPER